MNNIVVSRVAPALAARRAGMPEPARIRLHGRARGLFAAAQAYGPIAYTRGRANAN